MQCNTEICKNLSSLRQRKIVWDLLRTNYIQHSKSAQIKIARDKFDYKNLLSFSLGANGEKKFLISAKWWNKWCDYVNFEIELTKAVGES